MQPSGGFHPGIPSPVKKRPRVPKKCLVKASPPQKSWWIISKHLIPTKFIFSIIATDSCPKALQAAFDLTGSLIQGIPPIFSNEEYSTAVKLIQANQRARWAAAALVRHWLLRCKVRTMNAEDLVTMEPPKQPVTILDWRQRKLYVYEASTILRDIRECLLQQDYLFPNPKLPRNLLTNETLTIQQFLSVAEQLMVHRRTNWPLQSLLQLGYNLPRFAAQNSTGLRYEALNTIFARPTSEDAIDLVYDFIRQEHEYNELPFKNIIYSWALHHAPQSKTVTAWRKLAYRFHELAIQIPDRMDCEIRQHQELTPMAVILCNRPLELIAAKNAWQQKRLLT